MDLYQHDSAAMFRFVLRGDLSGMSVREFEQAWNTATSIATRKEIVVDLSGVANADAAGVELLSRMRESGVRLIPAPAAPEAHRYGGWAARLMQLWHALGVILAKGVRSSLPRTKNETLGIKTHREPWPEAQDGNPRRTADDAEVCDIPGVDRWHRRSNSGLQGPAPPGVRVASRRW